MEIEAAAEKAKEEIERLAKEVLVQSSQSSEGELKEEDEDGEDEADMSPVEENIDKMDLSVVESSVNLDEVFQRMETEEIERPKSDEQLEQNKRVSDYHEILDQTRVAIDLCNHRLREEEGLRVEDFELGIENNVKVR